MASEAVPTIHPSAYIGPGVELGAGVSIGPFATIFGPTVIGDGVWIGAGASIGAPPEISSLRQNTAWTGDLDHQGVLIGEGSVIRERVVVHQGSERRTVVGAGCWVLNGAYLAHDVQLGDEVTVSAGVSIGGHCTVGDRVTIGMNATIHQRRFISAGAMIGMGTTLTGDVPPFGKVYGVPPRLHGPNVVAMRRRGIGDQVIEELVRLYEEGDVELASVSATESLQEIAAEVLEWRSFPSSRAVRAAQTAGGE